MWKFSITHCYVMRTAYGDAYGTQWCVRRTAYGTGWLGGLSSIIACNNTMYLLVYFHPYNVFSLYHFDSWAHFLVFTATPKLLLSFLFVRFSLSFLLSFVFNYFYSVDRSVPTWCVSVPIKRKTKQMPTVSIWSSWSNMKQSNTTTERNGNIKCVCVCVAFGFSIAVECSV